MKIFRSLLHFYIQSSLHVSLAVTALTAVTLLEFGYPLDSELLAFIFLGTVTGYNFVKYAGVSNLHHLEITPNIRFIQILSAVAFLGLIYVSFQLPISVVLVSGMFGGLTILYAFPFYNGRNLRMFRGLKIYIIALVWAGSTVIVPLVAQSAIPLLHIMLEFAARFLFVIALTLPFEIRDMKYDSEELGTLPQTLGVMKIRILGVLLLGGMFVANSIEPEISFTEIAIHAVIALVTIVFIWKAKKEQGIYYSSFWVEGIPILWFLLVYLQRLLG
jgi:hypothetical protein